MIIYPCNYRNAVRAVVVRNPLDLDLCVLFLIEIVSYGSRNLSVSLLIRTLDVSTTLMLIHCFSILLHKLTQDLLSLAIFDSHGPRDDGIQSKP